MTDSDDNAAHHEGRTDSSSRVDQAFQDLYGFRWGTTFQLHPKKDKFSKEDPTTQLLIQMLGRTSAARILRYTDHVTTGRMTDKSIPASSLRSKAGQTIQPSSSRNKSSTTATKPIPHKKDQHVKHPTVKSSQNLQHHNMKPPPVEPGVSKPAGVDQLLQQLEGSGKVSTIAKTSSDWEHFKEKSGLGERLEEQADSNTSYLQKQDFLQRVDNRTFEVERNEREKQRGK